MQVTRGDIGEKNAYRADSRFVPSQWVTLLQSNTISHWMGANLESAWYLIGNICSLELKK